MTNNQQNPNWDLIFISCQTIYLVVASGFVGQQKYIEAVSLLYFSGLTINLADTRSLVIKTLNRVSLSLAVIISVYWLYGTTVEY